MDSSRWVARNPTSLEVAHQLDAPTASQHPQIHGRKPFPPQRLRSIDALRGLAALVVVLAHCVEHGSFVEMNAIPAWLGLTFDRMFSYGRVGVTLFFLISGLCIHLRWARAKAQGRTPDLGFATFWKRRLFRLYPPFLAALGIYLVAQTWSGAMHWDSFGVYDLLSHLFMLHNFDERTIFSIEGVFWTLAIEEQLYLAYFLLLHVRGRWGWGWALALCLVGRIGWFGLAFVVNRASGGFRLPHDGGSLAHWFVWALGAVAIETEAGLITLPDWTKKMTYAGACLAAAIACDLVSEYHLFGGVAWRLSWLVGAPLWGVGLFVLVNRLISAETRWRANSGLPRLVNGFAALGLFSYSTYLMHHFVLLHLDPPLFRSLGLDDSLANKLLSLPLCYAFSWIFFLGIERHFIARPGQAKARQAREAGLTSRWTSVAR
ncbi:acyltransferase family protein [Tundrisphaera lichenicola]|uniref:acyltransferase family protein n=1 Tax=Tundrisphaera lichenicola TaxID=2029860 RepID=UPI003EB86232